MAMALSAAALQSHLLEDGAPCCHCAVRGSCGVSLNGEMSQPPTLDLSALLWEAYLDEISEPKLYVISNEWKLVPCLPAFAIMRESCPRETLPHCERTAVSRNLCAPLPALPGPRKSTRSRAPHRPLTALVVSAVGAEERPSAGRLSNRTALPRGSARA